MKKKQLLENGYREYRGKDVNVYFKLSLCTHSAHCVRSNKDVFKVCRRPWILPDNGQTEEVIRIVDGCPSGALQYLLKEEAV